MKTNRNSSILGWANGLEACKWNGVEGALAIWPTRPYSVAEETLVPRPWRTALSDRGSTESTHLHTWD